VVVVVHILDLLQVHNPVLVAVAVVVLVVLTLLEMALMVLQIPAVAVVEQHALLQL
jgi:hypothetical protein